LALIKKAVKALTILRRWDYQAALRYGVFAAIEHEPVLRTLRCNTVVDIGAHSGQFALTARHWFPDAKIISFEPLSRPAEKFFALFSGDKNVILYPVAIGPEDGVALIHISGRDDSSSLLPITALQNTLFPGTKEKGTQNIQVKPLDAMLEPDEIKRPALLKLDIQGYELQALKGCTKLLDKFNYVYVECSFMELYAGQALADEVIFFLKKFGFRLTGVHNLTYDSHGKAVQADFLFEQPAKIGP
jgi:FkbM family methyltransferase